MFDDAASPVGSAAAAMAAASRLAGCSTRAAAPLGSATIRGWRAALVHLDDDVPESELVDQIRALEELKAAAAAAQARAAVRLHVATVSRHAAAGLPPAEQGRGVAAQVALARRESPHQGGRHLGLAMALTGEMPHTLRSLADGRLSEWRATLLVRETACLTREDRGQVDRELVADPETLDGLGNAAVVAAARRLALRLDPEAVVRRNRRAESERRVTLRPAPDAMSLLGGLLPVAQGVATYAALTKEADAARAAGDPRSRGQIMADTLVERVTGQSSATNVAVRVDLVMTDRALLAGDDEPALLPGYGPIPAESARDLLAGRPVGARTWLRRLFTHPATGQLVAMDSRPRRFPDPLRELIVLRDQTCRTPWCDAAIRHADHAIGVAEGGRTEADNGQGLCEGCNYTKQAPGWRARPGPGSTIGDHSVVTTTPTGHRYLSRPPPLPGQHRPPRAGPTSSTLPLTGSALERELAQLLRAA